MNIYHHPEFVNDVLRAPPGETDVVDLPINRVVEDGHHIVSSFWKPTPAELAALNASGCVLLRVYGVTAPPMFVGVIE